MDAKQKCTVIETILIDKALLKKKPNQLSRRPNGKQKLRRFVNQRKEASRTTSNQEKSDICKFIQKETNAIEKARKTSKLHKIHYDAAWSTRCPEITKTKRKHVSLCSVLLFLLDKFNLQINLQISSILGFFVLP